MVYSTEQQRSFHGDFVFQSPSVYPMTVFIPGASDVEQT